MKKCLFILMTVLAVFPVISNAQSAKFISVKGKEIIGADGQPFLMKGTNVGNWLIPEGYMFKFTKINSPKLINQAFMELIGPDETKIFWKKYLDAYITQADIHFMKTSGMNTLRVPFSYRLFTNEDYLGENNPNRGFELLDKLIGWCKAEGIYVILDMHSAPGGQTGDNIDDGYGYPFLFQNEGSRQETIQIWTRIADHYKNETAILGYDLLNEPIAHYFKKEELNPYLEPFYKELTKAVRTVDKNHLIILGGAQWDSNMHMFGPPFDSKLVYTFHKYWTPTTQDVIQEYIDFRDKYNVPIYCGETGENKDPWVGDFRKLLEANNIGWTYWPYKKMDNVSGIITFKRPMAYDTIINYTEKQRISFEDIRKAAPTNRAQVKQALYEMLENCKFENCTPNNSYIQALGLVTNK
ncbi:glycoside hydrolase family 5 protein [Mucilaginibacter mallensis]|nr:glycoside hydrolase family 5 protein [Mucilaginibacter mallensis]